MKRAISIVLFWVLMAVAAVALWRTTAGDLRGTLRTSAFVVPFVLFTSWLQSRFKGSKKRPAMIMINSALFAMVAGSVVVWDVELLRSGFRGHGTLVESVVAGALFLISVSVLVWSLLHLLRRSDKLPV
jgi:hypothetical protein